LGIHHGVSSIEIGEKIIFAFHIGISFSEKLEKVIVIEVEIVTFCEIFERIRHSISTTKISLGDSGPSDFL